jgi:hypothetical protein
MPLFDAGPLHDPIVRGIHQLLEILVRQLAPRQIRADAAYDGTGAFQDAPSYSMIRTNRDRLPEKIMLFQKVKSMHML